MDSFGAYLRQLREGKGISVEEISSRTKISLKYLKALEEDDLAKIPNVVFAKGFIRSYARCLALEENEVLARFDHLAASFYHQKAEEIRSDQQKQDQEKESANRKQRLMQWGAGLTVLVIAAGLFMLNAFEHRKRQLPAGSEAPVQKSEDSGSSNEVLTLNLPKGQNATSPSTTSPESQPKPILSVSPPAVTAQSPVPSNQEAVASEKELSPLLPSRPSQEPALPEPLTLRIEAIERSWVLVKIDNDVTKEVLLNPGEKVDWTAQKQFRLDLGNAGGVKIYFNGQPLDPLGPSGAVVKNLVLPKE
jgi:cytoskeleton protein RodZ